MWVLECIVQRPLIKHNDIMCRKAKDCKRLLQYFQKYFQTHFRFKKKKRVKKQWWAIWVPDIFHIFITIKWQFSQRNEYCILIGVICTRISCIIHGGGDHRWVRRRQRLQPADASGGRLCTVTTEAQERNNAVLLHRREEASVLIFLIFFTVYNQGFNHSKAAA